MNIQSVLPSRRALFAGAATLSLSILLSACGGGGDSDDGGVLPDSITISEISGTDAGKIGDTFKLTAKVVTTGDIPASQITYQWEQTEGSLIAGTKQTNGDHESSIEFIPLIAGTATFRVVATTQSGKTSNKTKTVTINSN